LLFHPLSRTFEHVVSFLYPPSAFKARASVPHDPFTWEQFWDFHLLLLAGFWIIYSAALAFNGNLLSLLLPVPYNAFNIILPLLSKFVSVW
jgi:hypothetical protein